MSRKKHFWTGLVSSYFLIGLNILYTLVSVPLVLHYLSQEEFGLWALIVQFSSYLLLIDLGVSASVSRLLADYKDRMDGPEYSRIFYSSFLVSLAQGVGLFALSVLVAWFAPTLANIPVVLRPIFSQLLVIQAGVTGLSLAFRSLASPLWSHQRLDICNLGNGLGLILSLGGLWAGLHAGLGLPSMILGSAMGVLPGLIIPFLACRHWGYYPRWSGWSPIFAADFRGLFNFSRDIFLFQLGCQMASATQIIVVSRFMSLESAAIWAVATKVFTYGQQFSNRILDSSAGALTEMYVRSEIPRLIARLGQLVEISAWLSAFLGISIVFFNTPFIRIWTQNRVLWPGGDNVWLALLLVSTCVARCHLSVGGITKEMATMRWIQLAEALVMLSIGVPLAQQLGFSGVLVASLLANAGVTLAVSQFLNGKRFHIPFLRMLAWLKPGCLVFVLGIIVDWALQIVPPLEKISFLRLSIQILILFLLGALSFGFCVRSEIRHEVFGRFHRNKEGT